MKILSLMKKNVHALEISNESSEIQQKFTMPPFVQFIHCKNEW